MNKALIIGAANIDKTFEMEHFVQPGETAKCLKFRRAWGGKGLNQAIALAKAGADISLAAQVAAEDFSELKLLCEGLQMDSSLLKVSDKPTGQAIIQVDKNGQNCIIVDTGANGAFEPETVRSALKGYGPGDILSLQNEINLLPEIIREGKARGLTIVLNPSPITSDIRNLPLDLVDIFVVNEVEGAELANEKEPEGILEVLGEKFPGAAILLTLGEGGSTYKSESEYRHVDALKVEAVDTTAAGDTYTGYFLGGLLEGKNVTSAMEMATVASAIAVSRQGAADSIPLRSEVEGIMVARGTEFIL